MHRQQLLKQLDKAWAAFKASYADLSNAQLTEHGVTGQWSVKDIIAHVTWWEEEALKHLPLILTGGRPPRYSLQYGGIDAFNAQMTEQTRGLSLADVLRQQDETHRRLIDYVQRTPEEPFTRETRFRRRLRLDTYSHYPKHAQAIQAWRERFNIFCSPCHGRLGDGHGMVVQRGFTLPPSFHTDTLRQAPVGQFFEAISKGFGVMPDYGAQVPPTDRWAIVAYIRALQLSQHATLADVPPEARPQLSVTDK
jgi:mono/diheme cytochrome c family protein